MLCCVSRIEWVWLHWSEYLKAYEEFELWLARQQRSLDVGVELQLGVREKLWQLDQQRVMVSDIHSQAALLERLLDEAAALHNRTMDPSVEPQAQERLQEVYNELRDAAEVRARWRTCSCLWSSLALVENFETGEIRFVKSQSNSLHMRHIQTSGKSTCSADIFLHWTEPFLRCHVHRCSMKEFIKVFFDSFMREPFAPPAAF